jgi:hypothetical protein
MEQKDFLLREIEKIGAIIRMIRQKLFGGTDELAISVANQTEALKEMLLSEAFIDIDELLAMDSAETDEYLAGQKGFNVENIELLARTLADIGMTSVPPARTLADTGVTSFQPASFAMLAKALQLYEICNLRDRTYSFEREAAISQLKELLQR